MNRRQILNLLSAGALIALLCTSPVMGDFFSPGTPNGFDFTTPMTDMGGGIWEYSWTGTSDDPTLFDILSESGNWDSKVHPAGNQWVTPDLNGGNTLTLDTNTYGDGWFPEVNRVYVASESRLNWTAVGDWQNQFGGGDWDNANANTAMSDEGGGIYSLTGTLTPGDYAYKAVSTGTWDAIGLSSRNVNSDNLNFSVPDGTTSTSFFVDIFNGTVRVENIPEPATLGLMGLPLLPLVTMLRRSRKSN